MGWHDRFVRQWQTSPKGYVYLAGAIAVQLGAIHLELRWMLFDIDREIDERRYLLLMFALQASEADEWIKGQSIPGNCIGNPFDEAEPVTHNGDAEVNPDDVPF
jgi:hypothetical protein